MLFNFQNIEDDQKHIFGQNNLTIWKNVNQKILQFIVNYNGAKIISINLFLEEQVLRNKDQ